MTQEQKNTIISTLDGLLAGFLGSYGIITVGRYWIFSLAIGIGALLFLMGMWKIMFHWDDED